MKIMFLILIIQAKFPGIRKIAVKSQGSYKKMALAFGVIKVAFKIKTLSHALSVSFSVYFSLLLDILVSPCLIPWFSD